MGLINTTTNLSYARNELIKVGTSFVFDKVADMIYYMMSNDDITVKKAREAHLELSILVGKALQIPMP